MRRDRIHRRFFDDQRYAIALSDHFLLILRVLKLRDFDGVWCSMALNRILRTEVDFGD